MRVDGRGPRAAGVKRGRKTRSDLSLAAFRQRFGQINASLRARHAAGERAVELVPTLARDIDALLIEVWAWCGLRTQGRICLVAVGGYGRGELHPFSDVDLLILVATALSPEDKERVKRFIAFVWDIGLHIGHSVRTLEQCGGDARSDPILATSLMEARLIAGSATLLDKMLERTGPDVIWTGLDFFQARCSEQRDRHRRFDDTASNLEPNVKDGPGALTHLYHREPRLGEDSP